VTQEQVAPSVRGLLWSTNAEALMAAALRGSGLALLPHFLAASAVSRGELQPVLTQWPSPPLGMFLAYTSRRNLHLRVRKLIDHLAVTLAGMIGGEHPVAQASLATRRPRMAESTAA
jgi:DNA-binding transcriptional LysR family regulator